METKWNNGIGPRERKSHCALVTKDGKIYKFTGKSIPGVCFAQEVEYKKNGKWSNSTFQIIHHETTSIIQWRDDWETGRPFPQVSWEEGYLWAAEKAPTLKKEYFEEFIRENFPKTAQRWDEAKRAEEEFGAPITEEEIKTIKEALEKIIEEKRKYEEELKRKREELKIRMESSPFAVLAKLKVRTTN